MLNSILNSVDKFKKIRNLVEKYTKCPHNNLFLNLFLILSVQQTIRNYIKYFKN